MGGGARKPPTKRPLIAAKLNMIKTGTYVTLIEFDIVSNLKIDHCYIIGHVIMKCPYLKSKHPFIVMKTLFGGAKRVIYSLSFLASCSIFVLEFCFRSPDSGAENY